jgi:hypothetical protein
MRIKKKKDSSREIEKLKYQLAKLQNENQKLMEYNSNNNNKNINDIQKIYEFIPTQKNYVLSRNIRKKDKNDYSRYGYGLKRAKLKSRLNSNHTNSRIISSAIDISGFRSVHKRKNPDNIIRINLNKRNNFQKLYEQNYELSPIKNKVFGNFNRSKNLNIINLNNIRIKNLGNLKYNKSVLNVHTLKNKLDSISSNYEIKQLDKELNKKIEKAALKRIKIKNMNSLNFQENVSDNKISNNENTNQNTNQTKSSSSNLIKLKNNNEFSINEKAEKEKIEEFKNLLQQIVTNIESQ